MSEIFTLQSMVSYWDVDRDQHLTLAGAFRLLQEAAIKHADQFGLGAKAMAANGESWVLHRIAAAITRYPRYEEPVKVVTWSTGIRGFRGYRELRLYCGDELVLSASSLWLYVSLRTKSLARVPRELADRFPVGACAVFRPDLEIARYEPAPSTVPATEVSLRYGDFDGNGHLNNTAYFDCLQTALSRQQLPVRPREIEIQFVKEVPLATNSLHVALQPQENNRAAFALRNGADLNAVGVATL
jgi:acyl-CoA thioesterase FadM